MPAGILLTAGLFLAGAASAQGKPDSKIDQQLQNLGDPAFAEQAPTSGPFTLQPLPIRVRDGKVLIDAVAEGDSAALAADFAQLGAEGVNTYGKIVSAWLPTDAIDQLGALKSLNSARPSYAMSNFFGSGSSTGSTTSQGDRAMYSDWARSWYGVDGWGIKVGILSDSFDTHSAATDLAGDIATGDLPPGIEILKDSSQPRLDEGRAMAQLIHDVAPGAGLSFHTAFEGLADFAIGIEELAGCPAGSSAECGTTEGGASEIPADVIVDDIIYFGEPMFQDGIIARAVDTVAAAGIPYYSSIGNSARGSYEAGFNTGISVGFNEIPRCEIFPNTPFLFPGVAHDFDPGPGVDVFQEFTLNTGDSFGPVIFQWDQPFFSQSTEPAGSASDYDVYLVLTDAGPLPITAPCVALGSAFNSSGSDPVEFLPSFGYNGPGSIKVGLHIVKFADVGPDAGLMKTVHFGGNRPDEFDTASATGFGHANAAGAEGVGAAFYADTPRFGVYPPVIEGFSSAGGVPILFDPAGNRLPAPEVRLKPGVTGPDGTNTTFFGFDVELDGFPNFFGTSAAAPHAAAVAALMLEANPALTPSEVFEIMRDTAYDMDDPSTPVFDAGFDFGTGTGLINARKAVAEAEKRKWLGGGGWPWY